VQGRSGDTDLPHDGQRSDQLRAVYLTHGDTVTHSTGAVYLGRSSGYLSRFLCVHNVRLSGMICPTVQTGGSHD
jgi:hypothetical protein